MFHYFKIPYFTCKVFTKFTYNEYIGPYFLSHVVLRFSPSDLPGAVTTLIRHDIMPDVVFILTDLNFTEFCVKVYYPISDT
jgi:hypothetical protein